MKVIAYLIICLPMVFIARWAWRRLDEELDDVFQTPIHNPYDQDESYGDIPNTPPDHDR
jgi:hypothetical protein